MNKRLFNMAKARQRDNAIADGFYDGRFREKVVEDKKKKQQRMEAKRYKNQRFLDEGEE